MGVWGGAERPQGTELGSNRDCRFYPCPLYLGLSLKVSGSDRGTILNEETK